MPGATRALVTVAVAVAVAVLAAAAPAASFGAPASAREPGPLPGGRADACPNAVFGLDATLLASWFDASAGLMIAADLDQDGREELVIGDFTEGGSLTVLRASGGRLGVPRRVPISIRPARPIAVDADGDGDLDLLVQDFAMGRLAGLRNDDGRLTEAWTIDDVSPSDQVSLRRGPGGARSLLVPRGDRGIEERGLDEAGHPGPVIATVPGAATHAVAIDADGDGIDDLIAARGASLDPLRLHLGLAGGGFGPPVVLAETLEFVAFLSVADVDGDGHDDLLAPQFDALGGRIRVLRNDPDGLLHPGTTVAGPAGGIAFSILAGDVDGDGHVDLVAPVATDGSFAARGRLELYGGDGRGGFDLRGVIPTTARLGAAIVDLDGDGRMELASVGGGQVLVHAWPAESSADLPGTRSALVSQGRHSIVRRAEATRDELLRIEGAEARLLTWDGRGTALLGPPVRLPGPVLRHAVAGPTIGGPAVGSTVVLQVQDGEREIVLAVELGPRGPVLLPGTEDLTGRSELAAAGDVDADGDVDAVILEAGGTSIRLLIREPAGWASAPSIALELPAPAFAVATGDVDGDGAAEVLAGTTVPGADESIIALICGRPGGPPPSSVDAALAAPSPLLSLRITDWESDGDVDVVVLGLNSAALLRQDRDGSFDAEPMTVQLDGVDGFVPAAARIDDVTGDGVLDVQATFGGRQLLGVGIDDDRDPERGPAFSFRTTSADDELELLGLADLDGDGVVELIEERAGLLSLRRPAGCPGPACPGDLDADGSVDFDDLLALLVPVDPAIRVPAVLLDLDGDGDRDADDLLILLGAWGPCPIR